MRIILSLNEFLMLQLEFVRKQYNKIMFITLREWNFYSFQISRNFIQIKVQLMGFLLKKLNENQSENN